MRQKSFLFLRLLQQEETDLDPRSASLSAASETDLMAPYPLVTRLIYKSEELGLKS